MSRIEGHAQVVIEVQQGEVISAHFQATEFRGFEHFVSGVPAEQMVVIVPRICGVCSTAHHLAAVKALEDVFDVTAPPMALKIRELLLLGQLIQNQATSLFIFTMPDRMGSYSILQREGAPASNKEVATACQAGAPGAQSRHGSPEDCRRPVHSSGEGRDRRDDERHRGSPGGEGS